MNKNPIYSTIQWMTLGCLLVFNHFVLKYKIWINSVVTVIILFISIRTTDILFKILSTTFGRIGSQVLPLGWQYKWFELLALSILIVILTEFIYKINRRY
jgi:hypothetical protein